MMSAPSQSLKLLPGKLVPQYVCHLGKMCAANQDKLFTTCAGLSRLIRFFNNVSACAAEMSDRLTHTENILKYSYSHLGWSSYTTAHNSFGIYIDDLSGVILENSGMKSCVRMYKGTLFTIHFESTSSLHIVRPGFPSGLPHCGTGSHFSR